MHVFKTFTHLGATFKLAVPDAEVEALPPVLPEPAQPSAAWFADPPAGDIQIGPISLSAATIAPGESVSLSAWITGKTVAFVYVDALLYDPERNQAYGPIYRSHVMAEQEKEVGGVWHPEWPETIEVAYEISPALPVLTDGESSAIAAVFPGRYGGESLDEAFDEEYSLNGQYVFTADEVARDATVYLNSDGGMNRILGFTGKLRWGAPRQITPNPGDQFVPEVQVVAPGSPDEADWQLSTCYTNQLTFHNPVLSWSEIDPLPGTYLVGLVVRDFDGAFTRRYAQLTISG